MSKTDKDVPYFVRAQRHGTTEHDHSAGVCVVGTYPEANQIRRYHNANCWQLVSSVTCKHDSTRDSLEAEIKNLKRLGKESRVGMEMRAQHLIDALDQTQCGECSGDTATTPNCSCSVVRQKVERQLGALEGAEANLRYAPELVDVNYANMHRKGYFVGCQHTGGNHRVTPEQALSAMTAAGVTIQQVIPYAGLRAVSPEMMLNRAFGLEVKDSCDCNFITCFTDGGLFQGRSCKCEWCTLNRNGKVIKKRRADADVLRRAALERDLE